MQKDKKVKLLRILSAAMICARDCSVQPVEAQLLLLEALEDAHPVSALLEEDLTE